ncbi:MAG: HEAT repeat domain-containing protein [Phycisphaerae bacterium]|nr:HEAT repeat domain-containing protein [Phycisphaerae bacterium]
MTRRTVVVLFMVFFTIVLWSEPVRGADVPSLEDLNKLPIAGHLTRVARGKIETYVGHWVEQLKKADKIPDVVKARKAITDGYNAHNKQAWQVAYAEISSGKVPVLFGLADQVKQIQAAMAVATMHQYTIQPALEKMARHKNPAVRYWAVRGYRPSVRKMLLYPERAKKMLATLERLGLKESGPILSVVLRTLNIHTAEGKKAVIHLRPILDKVWAARLKDLRAGKDGIIDAYRNAIIFFDPADKEDKKIVLQMLIDTLESASKGFDKAASSKSKKSDQQSWVSLLSNLENKLAELTQTSESPIQDILSDPKKSIEQKADEVSLMAVSEYWKPLLAKLGVKPRPLPATTTKPVKTTTTTPLGT